MYTIICCKVRYIHSSVSLLQVSTTWGYRAKHHDRLPKDACLFRGEMNWAVSSVIIYIISSLYIMRKFDY